MDTQPVKVSDEMQLRSGQKEFEEAIIASLDMKVWDMEIDLTSVYDRIGSEVLNAVRQEESAIKTIRNEILPQLKKDRPELPFAGIQKFSVEQIEKAHRGLLFNGGVTAVDATRVTHDTLPVTITQIGVCLVSYNGNFGSYAHRLFRRDLQLRGEDMLSEVMQLLEARKKRGAQGIEEEDMGRFSILAQRGLMAYAERAILMEEAQSSWRMGHGNPFAYELFVNFWASKKEVTARTLGLLSNIVDHQRFVYIPSTTSSRHLITLGNALEPLEFVLIDTAKQALLKIIESGNAREPMRGMQLDFAEKYGDQVVVGLFRCSTMSPPYLFYAHRNQVHTAALISIADGLLQEHRGFPMLIDLADQLCYSTFHPETFFASIRQAYADAGQPFRFLGERETRNR
ncbi:MAG: hypothetical protein JNM22_04515 [Saprospiraceae bacterium]|nr:hypothetical protein [Saprospiraceae bacterium]